MKVEIWPISRPKPYNKNPRTQTVKAVNKVAASIKEFGFRQPIVVDKDDVIVVGHKRFLAAMKLGMETVPVLVALDLTPAQIKAYRIADNRTNDETDWDVEFLADELAELEELDFDLDLTAFDPTELDELLKQGAPSIDDPEPKSEDEPDLIEREIIIKFASDASVQEFARLVGQKITRKTQNLWFPAKTKNGHDAHL